MTNDKKMKKTNKPKKYNTTSKTSKVEEPMPLYRSVKALPSLKDFNYTEFKKIADKTPFTLAEWASILHVSERTIHRYAKNNGHFAPINAERAMQIAKILDEGAITFGSIDNFYTWLKTNPTMPEGDLSFDSLTTTEGIQMVGTQLGRIQHGILA
jgi:DNA-binding transcriptional regulator YiaG